MTKCIINAKFYGVAENGQIPDHFGYKCEILDGNLVGEVPDELVDLEVKAGRVKVLEGNYEADQFTDMDRDDLKAYLVEAEVQFPQNISGVRLLELCRATAKA
jgi:phospholipid N-methyltransferase